MARIRRINNEFQGFIFLHKPNSVRVHWWRGANDSNFGDAITPYIIEKLSGKKVQYSNKYCLKPFYLVTGSILCNANKNSIIWGSGIVEQKQKIKKPNKILAVRGPLTRKRLLELGYECPKIYGDPALILPKIYNPKVTKRYQLGIIPHYVDYEEIYKVIDNKNIKVINLLDPIEKVIKEIKSCKYTISSSLHGIITSHAYGIKSVWVGFSNKLDGDGTKFKDYFCSVKIKPYKPYNFKDNIPNTSELVNSVKNSEGPTIHIKKLMEVSPFKK